MIPRSYIIVGALVGTIAVSGASGAMGYLAGSRFKQGQWDAAVMAEKKGQDQALAAAAKAIAKIEVKSEQHIQPLRTEIRTNTVYRDCAHTPDGLRHLNALITGEESEPAGGGQLPSSNASR
jgi:hypothetical protein